MLKFNSTNTIMKKILLAMICSLFSLPMLCEEHDLQALLHKLDDAIEQSDVIEQQHRKAIENLLKMFDEAVDDKIRYKFCLDLFFQYKKCNLDSMYIYAKEGWLLAKKMDDYEKIQSSMLNVADAYKKLARYDEALNILQNMDKNYTYAWQTILQYASWNLFLFAERGKEQRRTKVLSPYAASI